MDAASAVRFISVLLKDEFKGIGWGVFCEGVAGRTRQSTQPAVPITPNDALLLAITARLCHLSFDILLHRTGLDMP